MPSRILLICCLLFAYAPMANGQADGGRFLRWAHEDAVALVVTLGPKAPAIAVLGVGTGLALSRADEPLSDALQTTYGGVWGNYLDVVNDLGDTAVTPVAAGVFGLTLLTDDTRLQDAAFTSLQALVYAGGITGALKNIVGRYRPDDGEGPYRFRSFSGHRSFPSGHTTGAFAVVTPWVLYYPHAVTYALFAVSASTGVARVVLTRHWPTDVLAGAAIGFFTARFLTRRHQQAGTSAGSVAWVPFVTDEAAGVTLRWTLR